MANTDRKFKIGDVVKLNSGGPDMTVTSLVEGQLLLNCRYYDGEFKDMLRVNENMLTLVKSAR